MRVSAGKKRQKTAKEQRGTGQRGCQKKSKLVNVFSGDLRSKAEKTGKAGHVVANSGSNTGKVRSGTAAFVGKSLNRMAAKRNNNGTLAEHNGTCSEIAEGATSPQNG